MLCRVRIGNECGALNSLDRAFSTRRQSALPVAKRCRPLYRQREPQADIAMEIGRTARGESVLSQEDYVPQTQIHLPHDHSPRDCVSRPNPSPGRAAVAVDAPCARRSCQRSGAVNWETSSHTNVTL